MSLSRIPRSTRSNTRFIASLLIETPNTLISLRTHKVIYRRYAGLFFSLCVDITDNELAYLECIHLFVEILDHFFSNVYLILDEFILAGELQETSKKAIIERMGELEKLE
ncbi:AP-2 complex subunit sigma isoform X2 [Arachis hypogaea]|uniref:AP-2 complex subunit sigma isoform X2 n=1 Tax=Arachis hypogaea TaxID=3818 RepID=UPI003B2100B7